MIDITTLLLAGGATMALSAVLPFACRPLLTRMGALDHSSERSSHTGTALRGLGLAPAFALVVVLGTVFAFRPIPHNGWLVALVAAAGLAAASIGLLEDLRGLSVKTRAIGQLSVGLASSIVVTVALGSHWAFVPLGCFAVAGFINAANFMDGVDGISGLHGVVFGASMAAIGALTGHGWLILIGVVAGAAFAAFLPWNLSGRKLFLGDVGSYLLGAVVASALVAATAAGVSVLATVACLVPYLADTGMTLARRVRTRRSWREPHRDHAYQRLSRTRLGHRGAAVVATAFSAACAAIGLLPLSNGSWLTPFCTGAVALLALTYSLLPARVESIDRKRAAHASAPSATSGRRPLSDMSAEEIVGRSRGTVDLSLAADYIRGRRVLVTGAGGSIGSEICRQVMGLQPAEIVMLDRDETALQQIQVELFGHGLLDTPDVVLADIRDSSALDAVFAAREPQVVFHAAALKHLPLLETYPEEAWKSNVMGTLNVLEASLQHDVATFVNISTDKAANPTSVLGRSKRLAEQLTAWAAHQDGGRYVSVRFGNVLGSRGSMLPLFRDLIDAGRPITVTHPDVTRYFMSIPEASQLVLQAGAIGRPGEALLLDMGAPVKVIDIARRMIDLADSDVEIVFTGLRPGEKLHEDLTSTDETEYRPFHPQISHTVVPPLGPSDIAPRMVTLRKAEHVSTSVARHLTGRLS